MKMKKIFLVAMALLLSASLASATSQKWTAGWNNFHEPLNYQKSKVTWSVNASKSTLSMTFKLVGATPSKLYQVGIQFFCTTFAPTFGQYPVNQLDGDNCTPQEAQGVDADVASAQLGVVTTDINGNGSFKVVVGPIAPGTYNLAFYALDGAGWFLTGGDGGAPGDFQSPGPTFGDTTTITIP